MLAAWTDVPRTENRLNLVYPPLTPAQASLYLTLCGRALDSRIAPVSR
jgi:hypothetical protein